MSLLKCQLTENFMNVILSTQAKLANIRGSLVWVALFLLFKHTRKLLMLITCIMIFIFYTCECI